MLANMFFFKGVKAFWLRRVTGLLLFNRKVGQACSLTVLWKYKVVAG